MFKLIIEKLPDIKMSDGSSVSGNSASCHYLIFRELYSLSECSHLVGRPEETPNVYQDYQHNQHTFDNSDTQNSLENQDNLDNLYYSQYNVSDTLTRTK